MFKFTIDDILNRHLWPSQVHKFPSQVGRFLGSRKPRPVPDHVLWLETLVSTFVGIIVIEAIFRSNTVFSSHHTPIILASYGASAILCFNAHGTPLAQPRNVLFGHFISALIGICIQKLFSLSAHGEHHYWVSGALSVALSSVAMSVFNCVHPPGGASALLPSVDETVREMSWWYLPVQLISAVLMIGVACIFGNIARSYPVFWWSPGEMGRTSKELDIETGSSVEGGSGEASASSELNPEKDSSKVCYVEGLERIEICKDYINVPKGIQLGHLEEEWLETLQSIVPREAGGKSEGKVRGMSKQ